MDIVIHLGRPSALEKFDFLLKTVAHQLLDLVGEQVRTELQSAVMALDPRLFCSNASDDDSNSDAYAVLRRAVMTNAQTSIAASIGIENSQVDDDVPETDRPLCASDSSLPPAGADFGSFSMDQFELSQCLRAVLKHSVDWSFRDISRFLAAARSTVLGTERYCTALFV